MNGDTRKKLRRHQESVKDFLEKSDKEARKIFSADEHNEVREVSDKFHVTATERVIILARYSIIARLRCAIPLLAVRNPGRKFTHKELAAVVCTSRERVGKSIARLCADGHYAGEITVSRKE
jgi:hypothetical protein